MLSVSAGTLTDGEVRSDLVYDSSSISFQKCSKEIPVSKCTLCDRRIVHDEENGSTELVRKNLLNRRIYVLDFGVSHTIGSHYFRSRFSLFIRAERMRFLSLVFDHRFLTFSFLHLASLS